MIKAKAASSLLTLSMCSTASKLEGEEMMPAIANRARLKYGQELDKRQSTPVNRRNFRYIDNSVRWEESASMKPETLRMVTKGASEVFFDRA
jgi:hypothetical protein